VEKKEIKKPEVKGDKRLPLNGENRARQKKWGRACKLQEGKQIKFEKLKNNFVGMGQA